MNIRWSKSRRQMRSSLVVIGCVGIIIAGQSISQNADAMDGVQSSGQDSSLWPAEFPSPGAAKLFENDRVIVWDKSVSTEPFIHKHTLDSMEILLEDGPIRGVNGKGEVSVVREHVANGGAIGWIDYIKAGLGPHSMVAADPQKRARILYIELKGTEPAAGLVNGRWPK